MNARSTSVFSDREIKSPNNLLFKRVQLLRKNARLFGRSTVSERSAYMSLFSSRNDNPTLGFVLKREAPVRMSRLRDFD